MFLFHSKLDIRNRLFRLAIFMDCFIKPTDWSFLGYKALGCLNKRSKRAERGKNLKPKHSFRSKCKSVRCKNCKYWAACRRASQIFVTVIYVNKLAAEF